MIACQDDAQIPVPSRDLWPRR